MSARRSSRTIRTLTGTTALLLAASLMTACGGGSTDKSADTTTRTGAANPAAAVTADAKLTAMLPEAIRSAGTLKIGTEALYPPYEYLAKDGQTVIGLDPDLVEAITKRLGVTYTMTNTAFDGLLPALEGGRFDIVSAAVTDTPERQKKYDFVDYFQAGQAIVVAAGNPKGIHGVKELCGRSVSVLISSAQEGLLKKFNAEDCASSPIRITALPSDQDALIQVQSGRADATFSQEPVGRYNAKQIGGGNAFEVANSESLFPSPLGFVFDKGSTELRDAWHAALQSLIADGTYLKVLTANGLESGAVKEAGINAGKQ